MVWGLASPNLRLARLFMWSRTVASTPYHTHHHTHRRETIAASCAVYLDDLPSILILII